MSPSTTVRTHSIATMGADGIGPEVVNAGVEVLKKLAQLDRKFKLEFEDYDWSSETYKKSGQYIPDGGLEKLRKHDAILFGAVGAPGTLRILIYSSLNYGQITHLLHRRTRSYLPLGLTTSYLSNLPAVC